MTFGLRLSRIRGGQPNSGATSEYIVDSTYAVKLYKGDPVILTATGIEKVAGATDAFDGVFAGVEFIGLDGTPSRSNSYQGAGTGTEHKTLVMDDPDATFEVATEGDLTTADIGKFASFTLGAGNDITGISGTLISTASLNVLPTGKNVRILRIIDKRTDGDTTQAVEVERIRP